MGARLAVAVGIGVCAVPAPAGAETLSNERTRTTWAHPRYPAEVLAAPKAGAKRVARLRRRTEDGFREVYVVLRSSRGQRWLKVRIPGRPNGRVGWVRRGGLGRLRVVTTRLVIDRRRLRITLYRSGKRFWSARVGIGAPDAPTPGGKFWIRERFKVRGNTIYGPYAVGTSAYSALSDWPGGGVVGIHGTNQPWLIPGRPSHGCIRMRNNDITYLVYRLPLGTPLLIH
jgi:L,D-transpeptidase catalytic domain